MIKIVKISESDFNEILNYFEKLMGKSIPHRDNVFSVHEKNGIDFGDGILHHDVVFINRDVEMSKEEEMSILKNELAYIFSGKRE